MPQALSDIMAQLDPVYSPQKAAVQSQINALPGQQAADQAGLDQTKTNAFGDINVQANDRGMSYSGVPIAEQAKYVGGTYLPAVANLKNTYAGKASTLQQSLLGLTTDQTKQAQNVYSSESNAEAAAQAQVQAEQIKASAARQAAQQQGLDMSALMGGGQQQQQAAQAPTPQDHLNYDIQNLIPKDYATRYLPGYTERQINRMQSAYPEIPKAQIAATVYAYRKQLTGT